MTVSGAEIVERWGKPTGHPIRYTCADTDSFAIGDLVWLIDERTVSGATTTHGYPAFAGIVNTEKVANDGSTEIGVDTLGRYKIQVSGATCVAGDLLALSGQNVVSPLSDISAPLSGASVVGMAEQAAADGETINVRVGKL